MPPVVRAQLVCARAPLWVAVAGHAALPRLRMGMRMRMRVQQH
jgi:hypothetical protein